MRTVEVLSQLQEHTSTVIVVPDLDKFATRQFPDWELTAKVLLGESVPVTVPEGHAFDVVLAQGSTAPQESFSVVLPLRVLIGEQDVTFGKVLAEFIDPTLVSEAILEDGRPIFRFTTPDRTVRYVLDDRVD